jgi:hypothetical protein
MIFTIVTFFGIIILFYSSFNAHPETIFSVGISVIEYLSNLYNQWHIGDFPHYLSLLVHAVWTIVFESCDWKRDTVPACVLSESEKSTMTGMNSPENFRYRVLWGYCGDCVWSLLSIPKFEKSFSMQILFHRPITPHCRVTRESSSCLRSTGWFWHTLVRWSHGCYCII